MRENFVVWGEFPQPEAFGEQVLPGFKLLLARQLVIERSNEHHTDALTVIAYEEIIKFLIIIHWKGVQLT